MNTISISDISTLMTHDQIEDSIEKLIQQFKEGISDDHFLSMADFVGQIDEISFLKRTVSRLREAGFLSRKRIGRLELDEYPDIDKAKILASVYSLHLTYSHFWILNGHLNGQITEQYFELFGLIRDLPQLAINVETGIIHFNLFEIVEFIQRKVTIADRVFADGLSAKERSEFIQKSIADLNNLSFIKGHNLYKNQMDYWSTVSVAPSKSNEHVSKSVPQRDSYPFTSYGKELFEYLMDDDVRTGRGKQADIAYYYWRMYSDKFVRGTQKDFKIWVEERYSLKDPLGKFRTLVNLQDEIRNKKYKAAVGWLRSSYPVE